jgi:hypothetical protein
MAHRRARRRRPRRSRRRQLELNDGMKDFMRQAGTAEAKKFEDERNFEVGFAAACQARDCRRTSSKSTASSSRAPTPTATTRR